MSDYKTVYGICENKCLEETMSKQQISDELNEISSTVFGIKKTERTTDYVASSHGPLPEPNTRSIYLAGIKYITLHNTMTEIPDNYYFEIVIQFTKISQRISKPSDLISIEGVPFKWLNDDLETGFYKVLHYHFTYDGINLCGWCTGYA